MGQYRLWLSFTKGIGFYIRIDQDEIEILIPFVKILIGLTKYAQGIYFFGKGE